MNILVVLEHHFFEDKDGKVWCERVVDYSYLQRYLLAFDNVYVLARYTKDEINIRNMKLASGPHVHFCKIPEFTGTGGLIKNYFNVIKQTKKYVNSNKIDCVLLRVPSIVSIVTYRALYNSHKPIAIEMVMSAEKMFVSNNILVEGINKLLSKYVKKMCLEVEGVSYVTQHVLQEQYPCKSTLNKGGFTEMYSSIDLKKEDYYRPEVINYERPNPLVLVHTGYMDDYRKGQHILIKVVKLLADRGIDVYLYLIGDGLKKNEFVELAKKLKVANRINFTGTIKDREIIVSILKKSDIFVMPTMSEGLPRSILEAMAVSLPCLASDVDGVPELLESPFLVHGFSPDAYADKIYEMYSDWYTTANSGIRNYNKALEYSQPILNEKRRNFYKKLRETAKIAKL